VKTLLITDVDNTLFDWQTLWFETFSAMSEKVIEISGVDPDTYHAECSVIHQKYGTSEYSHLLEELPCLQAIYGSDIFPTLQPAVDAFRVARTATLKLYDGVIETLETLRASGTMIAAYTESLAFYTSYRFRKLGLDGLISYLYSPADHLMPVSREAIRKYDSATYELKGTAHRFTPEGELKPNPDILLTIITELGYSPEQTAYVGDNPLKDVYMAQQVGVLDIHAAYGAGQHRKEEYDLLKKVTHWTPEMVAREQAALRPGAITPTHTLSESFAELLPIMQRETANA
jgi:phosphoglycolate phosphatase